MARTNGIYDTLTFKPYTYEEYPKWITLKDGKRVVVEGRSDELRAIANDTSDSPVSLEAAANAALADKDTEIATLRAQLETLAMQHTAPAKGVLKSGSVLPKAEPAATPASATPKAATD